MRRTAGLGRRFSVRTIPANCWLESEATTAAAMTMSSRSPGVMTRQPRLKRLMAFWAPMAPMTTLSTRLLAAPGEFGDVIQFVGGDFVEDDADDFHALLFEDRLVEINLVNGFADAALADEDDFCAQDFGHLGVGQIKNRADAGVARAFAQDKILFPGDAVKGL